MRGRRNKLKPLPWNLAGPHNDDNNTEAKQGTLAQRRIAQGYGRGPRTASSNGQSASRAMSYHQCGNCSNRLRCHRAVAWEAVEAPVPPQPPQRLLLLPLLLRMEVG